MFLTQGNKRHPQLRRPSCARPPTGVWSLFGPFRSSRCREGPVCKAVSASSPQPTWWVFSGSRCRNLHDPPCRTLKGRRSSSGTLPHSAGIVVEESNPVTPPGDPKREGLFFRRGRVTESGVPFSPRGPSSSSSSCFFFVSSGSHQ